MSEALLTRLVFGFILNGRPLVREGFMGEPLLTRLRLPFLLEYPCQCQFQVSQP
jgi:hypothetical protein